MTVRKGDPMDYRAAMSDDFDALLAASSLGAPHVLAEVEPIPTESRRRMTHAAHRQQPHHDTAPDVVGEEQAGQLSAGRAADDDRTQVSSLEPTASNPSRTARPRLLGAISGHSESTAASKALEEAQADTHAAFPWTKLLSVPRREESSAAHPHAAQWRTAFPSINCRVRYFTMQRLQAAFGDQRASMQTPDASPYISRMLWLAREDSSLRKIQLPPVFGLPRHVLVSTTGTGKTQKALMLLHALGHNREQPLRDLRTYIQPVTELTPNAAGRTGVDLKVHRNAPPPLHVARFSPSAAFARADNGLHLPVAGAAHHWLQTWTALPTPAAAGVITTDRGALQWNRTRLWITTTDGVHAQHADVPMQLHDEKCEAHTYQVQTRLTYRVADPYAVEARFKVGSTDETVWTFSRDLLREGVEKKTGLGDVTIWPKKTPPHQAQIFIRLTSPEGTALLSVAEAHLSAFIEAAGKLVAYGAEHTRLRPVLDSLETQMGELARPGRHE